MVQGFEEKEKGRCTVPGESAISLRADEADWFDEEIIQFRWKMVSKQLLLDFRDRPGLVFQLSCMAAEWNRLPTFIFWSVEQARNTIAIFNFWLPQGHLPPETTPVVSRTMPRDEMASSSQSAAARTLFTSLVNNPEALSSDSRDRLIDANRGQGGLSISRESMEEASTGLDTQPQEDDIQQALPRTRIVYSPHLDALGRDLDVNNPALVFFIGHQESEAQKANIIAGIVTSTSQGRC